MMTPDDEFEKLLAEALDPGEIELSSSQRSELLAAFATVGAAPHAAEAAELEDFTTMLAGALDPGEIDFEDEQRRELIRQMTGAAAGDNLTAWALGEMPPAEREQLERRMEVNDFLRQEALSYRRFCARLTESLPALARPAWRQRFRLRHVVFGTAPRAIWATAAAAIALLLALVPRPRDGDSTVTQQGNPGTEAPLIQPALGPAVPGGGEKGNPESLDESLPRVAEVSPSPLLPPVTPAPLSVSNLPDLLPLEIPAVASEPAYAFTEPARSPVVPHAGEVPAGSALAELPEIAGNSGVEWSSSQVGSAAAGLSAPFMDGGGPGEMILAANDSGQRTTGGDTGVSPGGSVPIIEPEFGSVALANLQPYILPGLLGGAASGRPEISEGQGNRTISADFRLLDLGLSAGNSVDAESWGASAGMTWQLTPEWQAGLSFGGIDSRLDVDGFGDVDVTGAAFGGSLDWQKDGFHAALAYELGFFDQELRRFGFGTVFPADQDATVHRLSFWFTREFEAGPWRHGPVVGFDGSFGSLDAYQENLPGGVAMAGRDFRSLTTLLGWQSWGRFDSPAGPVFPNLVAGWRHRPIVPDSAIFQSSVGQGFAIEPEVPGRDSLLLEGGLRWLPGDGGVFFDLTGSSEWRNGGESDKRLLLEVGTSF